MEIQYDFRKINYQKLERSSGPVNTAASSPGLRDLSNLQNIISQLTKKAEGINGVS